MTIIRCGPITEVVADADVVTNADLTPTARLAYVLLQLDARGGELPCEVPELLGLSSREEFGPYLEELAAVGLVGWVQHAGEDRPTLEVAYRAGRKFLPCTACEECRGCACSEGDNGLCRRCAGRRRAVAEAKADIARYRADLDAGKTYAYASHGSRLHRWDCPTLGNAEDRIAAFVESLKTGAASRMERLPLLFTAEELRKRRVTRKRCATCGPDPL